MRLCPAHCPPVLLASLAGAACTLGASQFPASFDLSSLNGTNGFVLNGIDPDDESGRSVASAGDVNGDGIDDLIIGARFADPNGQSNAGESYIVFGGHGVGASGSVDLSSLNGTNGFVLRGIDPGDFSGTSASSAGDINGDGYDDLIIGADGSDPSGLSQAGESYVVFGGPSIGVNGSIELSALNGASGFAVKGSQSFSGSGLSVSSAGDINGDGFDDIIIGSPGFDANPYTYVNAGMSYVMFGGPSVGASGSIELSSLNGTNGFKCIGQVLQVRSGFSVAAADDVNGDGFADLIIGAPGNYSSTDSGECYVVFGGPSVGASGSIRLRSATLSGTTGFIIKGIDSRDYCGYSVSSAGDVNGDGIGDLLIGAPKADPNSMIDAGESYVIFGGLGVGTGGSINLSSLTGANGFTLNGKDLTDATGHSVSAAGDVNGDGIDDLLIGAWRADPDLSGAVFVVFGGPSIGSAGFVDLVSLDGTNGFVLTGIDEGDGAGHSVSSAGDVNADGIGDFIIGARLADPDGRSAAGETYVVFGRAPIPCSGDINNDGNTNAADFVILAGNFSASVTPNTNGDLNGDGLVNAADFVILAGDFGCGTP